MDDLNFNPFDDAQLIYNTLHRAEMNGQDVIDAFYTRVTLQRRNITSNYKEIYGKVISLKAVEKYVKYYCLHQFLYFRVW